MKSVLIVLVALVSFPGILAQEINKLDAKGQRHGIWKGIYEESKRPRYEGAFEQGKEIGIFKFFDDTKELKVIATRDFTAKDGSAYTTFFNQRGMKVSEGKEVGKQREGEWKYYHFNSKEIMTIENYKNGNLNGIRKVFFKNGVLAEETAYENGLKSGIYRKYTESGIVLEDALYENDEFHGPVTYKNVKGEVVTKGQFQNGKKTGIWKYYEKGKLIKEADPNKPVKTDIKKEGKTIKNYRKLPENNPKQ